MCMQWTMWSNERWIKWKWISECVCNEPCDQMKDEEFDDEMRQLVIHSNDHNIKENKYFKADNRNWLG